MNTTPRPIGSVCWFEYHCWESMDSADAHLWVRSHQQVTVGPHDVNDAWEGSTFTERMDLGAPWSYTVTFSDGTVACAMEDELLDSRDKFTRADPP